MVSEKTDLLPLGKIVEANERLKGVVMRTPLMENLNLSQRYRCNIKLKREDLQIVRSYKLRGAYNKMSQLDPEVSRRGIVCASAGNHAQGVAFSCHSLNIKGKIFMPGTTPKQKVQKVQMFGRDKIEIVLVGDTYDEAYSAAMGDCAAHQKTFIHPFDDREVMAGQGTVAMEILAESHKPIDYIFLAIGGGGLASGLGSYLKHLSPKTQIIGVEPAGAPAMYNSLKAKKLVTLEEIDKFVDGAAVQRVGVKTFEICQKVLDDMLLVPEGKVCSTILQLYNEEAIVAEPAGALAIAALDQYADKIKGKEVVCVVSGGNNDIMRTEEIKERSLLYEGLKHYFVIRFPQRAGALREFLVNVLGPNDDITHFEYTKKNNREAGPALVGVELNKAGDFQALIKRMEEYGVNYQHLNESPDLFTLLV
ncbi:MAG: threonine ammonia-lyase IlvA [Bacteroidota bacterium]